MNWPAQSPDLNPIEQMWEHLDRVVRKSVRTNKNNLFAELSKAWDNIAPKVLKKYIYSMQSRCQAVINAKGGHTRY